MKKTYFYLLICLTILAACSNKNTTDQTDSGSNESKKTNVLQDRTSAEPEKTPETTPENVEDTQNISAVAAIPNNSVDQVETSNIAQDSPSVTVSTSPSSIADNSSEPSILSRIGSSFKAVHHYVQKLQAEKNKSKIEIVQFSKSSDLSNFIHKLQAGKDEPPNIEIVQLSKSSDLKHSVRSYYLRNIDDKSQHLIGAFVLSYDFQVAKNKIVCPTSNSVKKLLEIFESEEYQGIVFTTLPEERAKRTPRFYRIYEFELINAKGDNVTLAEHILKDALTLRVDLDPKIKERIEEKGDVSDYGALIDQVYFPPTKINNSFSTLATSMVVFVSDLIKNNKTIRFSETKTFSVNLASLRPEETGHLLNVNDVDTGESVVIEPNFASWYEGASVNQKAIERLSEILKLTLYDLLIPVKNNNDEKGLSYNTSEIYLRSKDKVEIIPLHVFLKESKS